MADLVRSTVEAMVPDLLMFMRKKVFTKKEIKDILKTRETFEYSFLRRTASKKDYLKAIQYEYQLELQRRDKFKTLKLKKQTRRDYSIIRRIIFIFDRLTDKYKSDVGLWKEYCLFCYKIKANKMFFKAVSNALTINWESLDIWLLAIYYHFEINKDPFKARKTFLKALKTNNKRKDFWLEYFRFELSFLEMIKKRKNVSGIEEEKAAQESKRKDSEESGNMEMFDDGDMEEEKPQSKKSANKDTKDLLNLDFVELEQEGLKSDKTDSLAVVVFESVVDQFPNDGKINSEWLQICNEFKGEWIEAIKSEIFSLGREKFGENPITNLNSILEMRSVNKVAFEHDTQEVLFEKVNKVLVDLNEYYQFLTNENKSNEEIQKAKSVIAEEIFNILLAFHKQILEVRPPNGALFEAVFSAILKNINLKEIENNRVIAIFQALSPFARAQETISDEFRALTLYIFNSLTLNFALLERISEVSLKFNVVPHQELAEAIRKAFQKKIDIPQSSQVNLMIHLYKLKDVLKNKDEVCPFLKEAIKHICFAQEFARFAEEFLRDVIQNFNIKDSVVSDCFSALFALKSSCPPSVSFIYINKLIELKSSNSEVKKHLQQAVTWHPNNRDLWLKYIEFEKTFGNPMNCPEIFQKAQKTVKDPNFVHEYTALLSN